MYVCMHASSFEPIFSNWNNEFEWINIAIHTNIYFRLFGNKSAYIYKYIHTYIHTLAT